MSLEQKIDALTEAVEQLTRTLQIQTAARAGASLPADTGTPGKSTKAEKSATTETTSETKPSETAPPSAGTATEPSADSPDVTTEATSSETELTPEVFYKDKLLPKFKDLLATGQQAKAKAALTKFNVGQLAQLPPDVKVYQAFLVEIGG